MGRIACGLASALGLLAVVSPASAEDVFLTIGGGPSPSSNQISLEKNVLFVQRTLAWVLPDEPRHDIFFADGKREHRDLQYRDPETEVSEAEEWMSRLFGNESATTIRYRDHQVRPVAGPARKAWLKQTIGELADRLVDGDRLILYVTAHGGSANSYDFDFDFDFEYGYSPSNGDANEYETTIALWNDESLAVSELVQWLNRLAPGVQVTMIMAQCYSGGFSHAIFHDGDADLGLNKRPRCGFFSQRHDRVAAGCTPEIEEADYQEYSTFFWAALGGQSRTGQPIDDVDYNGDGRVSFAEAHAYATIASETIDIPVRTSGAFLRQFSRIGKPVEQAESEDQEEPSLGSTIGALFGGAPPAPPTKAAADDDGDRLLTWQTSIATALQRARPDQRAIITALTESLEIPLEQPVRRVRGRFRRAGEKLEERMEAMQSSHIEQELARGQLVDIVHRQWPEMAADGYTPVISELTGARAEEFVRFVHEQPEADALLKAGEKSAEADEKLSRLAIREAKLGRLLRTLQNVLLEENLPKVAAPETVEYFERLMAMEEETLQSETP